MDSSEILTRLQAGIVKPNKREVVSCYFLQFKAVGKNNIINWIKKLQITFANDYKKALVVNFFVSANGYSKIYTQYNFSSFKGLVDEKDEDIINTLHRNESLDSIKEYSGISHFTQGMASEDRQKDYGDPEKEELEYPYRENIDALLVLSSDDESLIERKWEEINNPDIYNLLCIENGKRTPDGIGHFGYKDGISKIPFYRKKGGKMELDSELLKKFITPEYGSFLVYRKLQQNVEKFKNGTKKIAEMLMTKGAKGDLEGVEKFVEGQIMGRFKDGTPIYFCKSQDERQQYDELIKQFDNSYFNANKKLRSVGEKDLLGLDYSNDRKGVKCPFHAHIRRMNPRDRRIIDEELPKNIVRRSINYDFGPNKKGLLFFCFQQSIEKQFSHLQKEWANDYSRYVPKEAKESPTKGVDLIAGQKVENNYKNRKWILNWNQNKKASESKEFSLSRFVEFLGGEFFYAPPKSWFDNPENPPYFMEKINKYHVAKKIVLALDTHLA